MGLVALINLMTGKKFVQQKYLNLENVLRHLLPFSALVLSLKKCIEMQPDLFLDNSVLKSWLKPLELFAVSKECGHKEKEWSVLEKLVIP